MGTEFKVGDSLPSTLTILFHSLLTCIVSLEAKSCEEPNILDILLNGYFPPPPPEA